MEERKTFRKSLDMNSLSALNSTHQPEKQNITSKKLQDKNQFIKKDRKVQKAIFKFRNF
ncbi:MAG: hypothetical protein IJP61_03335 [Treponema sp.]|nr:hypothetical protein [Treponema sp.]